ncbi:MAG: BolA family protein [Mariprofundaceae bacterium]|nr:BolA family protein [Mariprofundaceae bacterium]
MNAESRLNCLRTRLETVFSPEYLHIDDESSKHAGHAGAKEQGGGHYVVSIRAASLKERSTLARHRAVNTAVKDLFGPVIHALTLHFPD